MIKLLSRKEIFQASAVADRTIAGLQQACARDFNPAEPEEAALLHAYYDHRQPVVPAPEAREAAVLAQPSATRSGYEKLLPEQLEQFLRELGEQDVFMLDWFKRDWQQFPFETEDKKQAFARQTSLPTPYFGGFRLSLRELPRLLPPLLYSGRYGEPVAFLFPASKAAGLAINLCDDGNLHLSFPASGQAPIEAAARASGWVYGNLALCQRYHAGARR